ncbi:MAG TPA: DUF6266 family protein [Pedobacter sp.]
MGKLKNGIMGPVSGKVANLVFVTDGDKCYVRSAPRKAKTKKRSIKQKAQANKLTLLSPLLNPSSDFLRIGFHQKGIELGMKAAAAAKSANLLAGIKGVFPDQEIDWENILVSDGDLRVPARVTVTAVEKGFEFTWPQDLEEGAGFFSKDRTMILLYCEELSVSLFTLSGAQRKELKDNFALSKMFKGKTMEVFISFRSIQSNEV